MAKKSGKGFLFGAIAGGVVGSVAALLLAPKSGKELRKDISEGAQVVSDHTVRIAGQVGDSTTRIAKQVGNGVSVTAVKVKETAGSVIGNVRSWRSGDKEDSVAAEGLEEAVEIVQEAAVADDVQEKTEELAQDRSEELQTIS